MRQEDLNRNSQIVDSKAKIGDKLKLETLLSKLVTALFAGNMKDSVIWLDDNLSEEDNPDKLLSQDIEILIGILRLIQSRKNKLGIHRQCDKEGKENPFASNKQGLDLLEAVDNDSKFSEVFRKEVSEYTSCTLSNLKSSLRSKIKKSIISPKNIVLLSAWGDDRSHATSVYMRNDGTVVFYDSNHGEIELKEDCYDKLAEKFTHAMAVLCKENLNMSFQIESWSLRGIKELAAENQNKESSNIPKNNSSIPYRLKAAKLSQDTYNFLEKLNNNDKKELLLSENALKLANVRKECYENLIAAVKENSKLSDKKISTLVSENALKLANVRKECYENLIAAVKEDSKLSYKKISALVSKDALKLANVRNECYENLIAAAKKNSKISNEKISALVSEDASRLAEDFQNSYLHLLDAANDLSAEKISALVSRNAYIFALTEKNNDTYIKLVSKAKDLSSQEEIDALVASNAVEFFKNCKDHYLALLEEANHLSPEKISALIYTNVRKLGIKEYKSILSKAKNLSTDHIKAFFSKNYNNSNYYDYDYNNLPQNINTLEEHLRNEKKFLSKDEIKKLIPQNNLDDPTKVDDLVDLLSIFIGQYIKDVDNLGAEAQNSELP